MIALSHGEPPARPSGMPDFPWSLVEMCCDFEPMLRPLPLQLMAKVAVGLTMPVVARMVMRGHPLDNSSSDLLRAIEVSLDTAGWDVTVELRSMSEKELALEVIRMLSLWSLGIPPESLLYTDALYRWCLDAVVHRLQPLPDGEDDEDGLIEPSKLCPFAKLLAAVDPAYADVAMLRFGRASVGTPIRFEEEEGPLSVVWFSDGDRIAVGSATGTAGILSTSSGATIRRLNVHEGNVNEVAISPDGRLLASCSDDRTVGLWDAETGNAVGEPMLGHTSYVYSVAFSPDGTHIASGSYDETIRIWSCETRATVVEPLHGHTRGILSVAYSPDGSLIVSGSWDKTIRVWDAQTGACILGPLGGQADDINSVAFSPDGLRFVSGSDDNTVCIWDAFSGEPVGALMEGHRDSVQCVAYSPDGARIASGSDDTTIRIWDAARGVLIHRPLRGHTAPVLSLAFSPDGRKLASASFDGTVRIWDATDEWTRWDI
ncbi:WD40 repeat-like protein [Exidia glandulosa HHB12029]|uniref:WD40 repeat-like protein n=1 Tax=Exidia glandulosa HHB12029 TaxID=1314781 RepID=A0A166AV40_EXIGL|nr:WD40 repeat-like protein [Exidia glandulosa HHB12029]